MSQILQKLRPYIKTIAATGIGLIVVGAILLKFASPGRPAGDGSVQIDFEVPAGAGAQTVGRELENAGLIRSAPYFRTMLRLTGRSQDIKVGIYELNDGMSGDEIADILTEGRVRLTALTIPEGWTNRQIGDYFAEKGFVRDRAEFLEIASDAAVRQKYNIPEQTTEGYLFPETYKVPDGYPAAKIQEVMIRRFYSVLDEIKGDQEFSPEELRKRIVLASIVEREAVKPEERPMMARVFLNRLDESMRLESCATVQYLFDKPRPRLFERDLKIESPYNTYLHKGLPPGPISNPGRAALEAAFDPVDNDYLFFVLKPDGSHHFSRTYQEHLNAKRRYIDS